MSGVVLLVVGSVKSINSKFLIAAMLISVIVYILIAQKGSYQVAVSERSQGVYVLQMIIPLPYWR